MASSGELSAAGHGGRRTTLKLTVAGGGTAGTGLARRRFRATRLAESSTRLEPRSVGRILDAACELFAARFALLFGVAFCLWLPTLLLTRVAGEEALPFNLMTTGSVDVLCAAFACLSVGAAVEGRPMDLAESVVTVLLRLPGLLVLAVAFGVASMLVPACCIGVVPLWLLAVVPTAYVLERGNLFRAVARGVSLVASRGAFVRWAGYKLIGIVMTLPFTQLHNALAYPGVGERLRNGLDLSDVALDVVIAAISAPYLAVGTAFLAVVQAVFYFDLRVRKEGYDLERRLDELERRAEEAAA